MNPKKEMIIMSLKMTMDRIVKTVEIKENLIQIDQLFHIFERWYAAVLKTRIIQIHKLI